MNAKQTLKNYHDLFSMKERSANAEFKSVKQRAPCSTDRIPNNRPLIKIGDMKSRISQVIRRGKNLGREVAR
jgi:hypothetical protein